MSPKDTRAEAKTAPSEPKRAPSEPIGTRTVLDAIVQAATVDLFRAHRVAVAPAFLAVSKGRWPDGAAAITFTSSDFTGMLTLCMPRDALEQVITTNRQSLWVRDALRELTNQLMGRIKNRLLQCNVTLVTSLPTTIRGDVLEAQIQKGRTRVFPFRLLRGEFFVILDGVYSGSQLTYSGSEGSVSEGDVIIFELVPSDPSLGQGPVGSR